MKELAAAAAYGTFLSRSGSALSRSSVRSGAALSAACSSLAGAAPSAACSSLAGAAPSAGAARPRPAALSAAAQLVRQRSSVRGLQLRPQRRSSVCSGAAPSVKRQGADDLREQAPGARPRAPPRLSPPLSRADGVHEQGLRQGRARGTVGGRAEGTPRPEPARHLLLLRPSSLQLRPRLSPASAASR